MFISVFGWFTLGLRTRVTNVDNEGGGPTSPTPVVVPVGRTEQLVTHRYSLTRKGVVLASALVFDMLECCSPGAGSLSSSDRQFPHWKNCVTKFIFQHEICKLGIYRSMCFGTLQCFHSDYIIAPTKHCREKHAACHMDHELR
jgi:hypothetical protein